MRDAQTPGSSPSGSEGSVQVPSGSSATPSIHQRVGSRPLLARTRDPRERSVHEQGGSPSDLSQEVETGNTRPPRPHRGFLHNVNARDWGVDYLDNDTFLDIIEYFFVWDQPTWSIMDEVSFFSGLENGGSEYCSALLVHSILAFGSKNYRLLNKELSPEVEQQALSEARRLFDSNADRPVPANIISGIIINAALACSGEHKIPTPYMVKSVHLAIQMGLYDKRRASDVYDASLPLQYRGRAVLAWGLFAHQAYFLCCFAEMPLLTTQPPVPVPDDEYAQAPKPWIPFPLDVPGKLETASSLHARAKLWSIAIEIVPLHHHNEDAWMGQGHFDQACAVYERLQQWHEDLAAPLFALSDAPPHLFLLQ